MFKFTAAILLCLTVMMAVFSLATLIGGLMTAESDLLVILGVLLFPLLIIGGSASLHAILLWNYPLFHKKEE